MSDFDKYFHKTSECPYLTKDIDTIIEENEKYKKDLGNELLNNLSDSDPVYFNSIMKQNPTITCFYTGVYKVYCLNNPFSLDITVYSKEKKDIEDTTDYVCKYILQILKRDYNDIFNMIDTNTADAYVEKIYNW
jgi:hypothetical protein